MCSPARESARSFSTARASHGRPLATSGGAIARATMERKSTERAPAAEKPSGVVYGRQRVAQEDRGPLSWAPVRLSEENIEFDTRCLETAEARHGDFRLMTKDSLTRIERDGKYNWHCQSGPL
jgi:hypothetical protein